MLLIPVKQNISERKNRNEQLLLRGARATYCHILSLLFVDTFLTASLDLRLLGSCVSHCVPVPHVTQMPTTARQMDDPTFRVGQLWRRRRCPREKNACLIPGNAPSFIIAHGRVAELKYPALCHCPCAGMGWEWAG